MTAGPSGAAAAGLIVAVALLRIAPAGSAPAWLHGAAWVALVALALRAMLRRDPPRREAMVVGALAVAAALIVRFGRYECWAAFATLCSRPPAEPIGWPTVFVNQDSFTYLADFNRDSLRPPFYGWFARAATLFQVPTSELMAQARSLIPYETDLPGMVAYLAGHPQPALQRIAQAQQIALAAAAVFFVWASVRLVPALVVALVVLALYDGGVMTHWYYARVIDGKLLYLAALFVAAGAALLVVARPNRKSLRLLAPACAALPLIRPQGLVAGLLLAFGCLRLLWAQPRISGAPVRVAAAALALFAAAAALPSVVTYLGHRVLQPSNIYALSRIAFALELATPDDVAALPDDVTRNYLTTMLAMRDDGGGRPAHLHQSLHRNQGIAMQACIKIGGDEMLKMICGNAMGTVAATVLSRHRSEYLGRIVGPALASIGRLHIGGALWSVPASLLLGGVLVAVLALTAPWLAGWGAVVIALHASLLVLLATLAAPDSAYLITGEPVLLAALAVMLVRAVRDVCGLDS